MIVSIIAAYAESDRGIGYRGRLPWRLPAELALFRKTTMGHALIMGRVTYQSLPAPLDGRRMIVLTRTMESIKGAQIARSLPEALEAAAADSQETETFIAGGESVYVEALQRGVVDRMYLSVVRVTVQVDAFFPEYASEEWVEVVRKDHPANPQNPYAFTWQLLERK